jgi:hemin uptake protein HemP
VNSAPPQRSLVPHGPPAHPQEAEPPRISSTELLRGQRVIEIEHEGQRYRLQATRQGKLILTK